MSNLKIMTVLGTRPEIIRLSRIISELDKSFNHCVVHTGQNFDYELNQIFFKDLKIREPDFYLNAAKDTFAETVGGIIIKVDAVLKQVKPDALLVLGDTNSSLSAIAAKKRKIPIFHIEAGNRCFDQRVPEETNRKIVDHISDINMTYSSLAKDYLINEGIPSNKIIKIGSPMREVLNFYDKKIKNSRILSKLNLKKNNFYLVSAHREENIDNDQMFSNFIDILNYLSKYSKHKIIVSTHPRTKKKIDKLNYKLNKKINFLKPLSFSDYNKLQLNAKVVLSDSGTISEESSILNFPALNIRETHERPEAMEEASVMLVGLNKDRIIQALSMLDHQRSGTKRDFDLVKDYSSTNISKKVSRIILSHIDFVNKKTWYKL